MLENGMQKLSLWKILWPEIWPGQGLTQPLLATLGAAGAERSEKHSFLMKTSKNSKNRSKRARVSLEAL